MTKKNRRAFSPAFKMETASLVLDQHYSIAEACRAMDVGETSLRHWVNQLQQEREGVTPQGKALTPEQQKIQDLEDRIKRLEMEKEILKKATALLISDSIPPSRR
jgi:transposase